jgi:hypothetical protein
MYCSWGNLDMGDKQHTRGQDGENVDDEDVDEHQVSAAAVQGSGDR